MRFSFVYLMTNRPDGVLYVGVTTDLVRRVWQYRTGALEGFTKQYGLKTLVWFETHEDVTAAIAREKALKHSNARKARLLLKDLAAYLSDNVTVKHALARLSEARASGGR